MTCKGTSRFFDAGSLDKIYDWRMQGFTNVQIAHKFGCHPNYITEYIQRADPQNKLGLYLKRTSKVQKEMDRAKLTRERVRGTVINMVGPVPKAPPAKPNLAQSDFIRWDDKTVARLTSSRA